MTASLQALLEVKNLSIEFLHRKGNLQAIHDLTLTMQPGEILGMVGESGAGKSLTGAAIAGLLQPRGAFGAAKSGLAIGVSIIWTMKPGVSCAAKQSAVFSRTR